MNKKLFAFTALLAFAATACTLSSLPIIGVPPTPTQTAIPTKTVAPSATPNATATQAAILKVTKTAEAEAEQKALIASALADIHALGIDNPSGGLVWYDDQAENLTVTDYGTWTYQTIADGHEFSNFIMKVDIQWISTSGLAGCGINFRSDHKDLDVASFYNVFFLRLSGLPSWSLDYYKDGQGESTLTWNTSSLIKVANGAVNTYYIVADGPRIDIYAQGKRLGSATSEKLVDGLIQIVAEQESGSTTCTFDNLWIWSLDPVDAPPSSAT